MTDTRAFGTWPSPLAPEQLAQAGVRLGDIAYANGTRYWSEGRPSEAGRVVLLSQQGDQAPVELLPAPWSARTRVHEYGGGAWYLGQSNLYFSQWDDQRLYQLELQESVKTPQALTPASTKELAWRYADGCESVDTRWLVCVRETHQENSKEPSNELVAVPTNASAAQQPQSIKVLVSGADFYAAPRLSADARKLSWIQWQHPQMPWDGTELWVADVDEHMQLSNAHKVAGSTDIAIVGANWVSDGRLVYSSDESAWWNLYAYEPATQHIQALTQLSDADIGAPAWVFGMQPFVEVVSSNNPHAQFCLALVVTRKAVDQLALLDSDGQLSFLDLPFCNVVAMKAESDGAVLMLAQSSTEMPSIVSVAMAGSTHSIKQVVRSADALPLPPESLSVAQAIEYPSHGRTAHAFFYAPKQTDFQAPEGELPPLLVMGHGGPTGHVSPACKLAVQFWTGRGVAVLDVNYGGSTGFGRTYRRLLNRQWGVVDVQDCIAGVQYLIEQARVDAQRVVIRGGSAGGLTVLRAVQTSQLFAAGTSLYGVSDLNSLATDTHKFESRYLDGLIGAYPEEKAIYDERSPINHTDELNCPLLVLQGDEDEVVPPSQSQSIVDAVASKSLPHAYVLFKGEQHGFRQAHNIARALQLELWFYGQVLGFEPEDNIAMPTEAVGFEVS